MSLQLFVRGLPGPELHHRRLTLLRGLQDFEPLWGFIDILTFHGTIEFASQNAVARFRPVITRCFSCLPCYSTPCLSRAGKTRWADHSISDYSFE